MAFLKHLKRPLKAVSHKINKKNIKNDPTVVGESDIATVTLKATVSQMYGNQSKPLLSGSLDHYTGTIMMAQDHDDADQSIDLQEIKDDHSDQSGRTENADSYTEASLDDDIYDITDMEEDTDDIDIISMPLSIYESVDTDQVEVNTLQVLPPTPLPTVEVHHALQLHEHEECHQLEAVPQIPSEIMVISDLPFSGPASDKNIDAQLEAAQLEINCGQVRMIELEGIVHTIQLYLNRTQATCETLLMERNAMAEEIAELEDERASQFMYSSFLKVCMGSGILLHFITGSSYFLTLSVITFLMFDVIFNYVN